MFSSGHTLHLVLVKAGRKAHAQQHDDHQHQAHGGAHIQVVAVAKELHFDQVADQQVGTAAQHPADDEGGHCRHEYHGDAGADAGHAHGDEHPEKGLGGGGSQILCRFHQALIDLGHTGVEGQDHVGHIVIHHAQHHRAGGVQHGIGAQTKKAQHRVHRAVDAQQAHPGIGTEQEVHPHGQHDQHQHDMLLVHPQAGQEIAHRKCNDQADHGSHKGQQQTAGKHGTVAADAGQVGNGEIAAAIGQGIIDHDDQRNHREQHHPDKIRIGQLLIVNFHHFPFSPPNVP